MDHYNQLHNHHHIIVIIIITTIIIIIIILIKSTFVRMLMTASSSDLVWIISVTVNDKFAMFSISTTALAEMLNIFVSKQVEWMKTINERWLIVSSSITLLSSYFCSFTPSYLHPFDCHPTNNDTPRSFFDKAYDNIKRKNPPHRYWSPMISDPGLIIAWPCPLTE